MPPLHRVWARVSGVRSREGRSFLAGYARQRVTALAEQPGLFVRRLSDWTRLKRHAHEYRFIDEQQLRATRKSDTIYIFGTGYSLNAIPPAEWREFERHDTLGFNRFTRQDFVRCDYLLIREIAPVRGDPRPLRVQLDEYCNFLRPNPRFANTIFLAQTGWRALNANQVIGLRILPTANRIFRWRTIIGRRTPSFDLSKGLTHAHGTLHECVNFAFLLGWKTIVLVGVDLYDRRQFWLTSEEAASPEWAERHATAQRGVVELIGEWASIFGRHGVQLYVYNPKSLLAAAVPVRPRAAVAAASS